MFVVAQDVRIPVIRANAKVHDRRSVPLIFYGLDEQNGVAKPELDRTFIRFVAGIAFDLEFHNSLGALPKRLIISIVAPLTM